jgi:sigma-B regulation protein RsbU (phosphoserine phosphatase)
MPRKKTKRQIERDEQIYQLGTLVAGEFSLQEVLDKLAEAAVKIVGVKACSIRLLDEDAGELKMRSTYGLSEEYRDKGVISKNDTVIKAAFAGEAVVLDDMRVDGRVKYKEATIKEGLVSQLILARAVASQCAVAITNAKLYAKAIEGARIAEQMRLAGIIQRKMIPEKAPKIRGLDISATYIPCFDVGGDFYDFLRVDDSRVIITIADIMGKGVPAALMMSWFRGAIRGCTNGFREVLRNESGIKREKNAGLIAAQRTINTIKKFNDITCDECRDGEFISLFYASIDAKEKTINYCNCGHEPTILIRDGHATDLGQGGLVLGVDKDAEYAVETVELKSDDCLLFYTDGLTDAVNFNNQLWGRENLLETAKKFTKDTSKQMLKNILGYRRRFVGLARQADDTSMVLVKVR